MNKDAVLSGDPHPHNIPEFHPHASDPVDFDSPPELKLFMIARLCMNMPQLEGRGFIIYLSISNPKYGARPVFRNLRVCCINYGSFVIKGSRRAGRRPSARGCPAIRRQRYEIVLFENDKPEIPARSVQDRQRPVCLFDQTTSPKRKKRHISEKQADFEMRFFSIRAPDMIYDAPGR